MTATQQRLNLAISQRTALLDTATVRAALGVDVDTVVAKVEAGEFVWVWNVAVDADGPMKRRFWARELREPAAVASLELKDVLRELLGQRENFRATEVGQLLLVDDATVFRLFECGALKGELVGRVRHIWRASLERFLTQRWLGGGR